MQDRYLVIAIIVILAICCLGGYVAVSGFLNSSPSALGALTPALAATPILVAVSTDTPAAIKPAATAAGAVTAAPVPSPLGAFETIAAASSTQPPPGPAPTIGKPTNQVPTAPVTAGQSCSGFSFCAKGGPPDAGLAPQGTCPSNYIWGRVIDKNGNGMPDMRIRFKLLSTGETDGVVSKGPPDTAGKYNIVAQLGGSWVIWLTDAGSQISPQITVVTKNYGGGGDCPTRVDFFQQ
jgi:hypothetical protein